MSDEAKEDRSHLPIVTPERPRLVTHDAGDRDRCRLTITTRRRSGFNGTIERVHVKYLL